MSSINLTWSADGTIDSYNVYRSTSTIDPASLPTPIATGITEKSYSDSSIVVGTTYYYRVASIKGGISKISAEKIVVASQFTTVALLKFDGNLNDDTTKHTYSSIGTTSFGISGSDQYAIFNGNYISTPYSTDFDFNTGDFKVSVRAAFTAFPSNNAVTFIGSYLYNDGWAFQYRNNDGLGNRLRFSIGDDNYADVAFTPTINQIYDFYVERVNGSITFKVDGVKLGSSINLEKSIVAGTSNTFNIGALRYMSSVIQKFNGYIYNVQLEKLTV